MWGRRNTEVQTYWEIELCSFFAALTINHSFFAALSFILLIVYKWEQLHSTPRGAWSSRGSRNRGLLRQLMPDIPIESTAWQGHRTSNGVKSRYGVSENNPRNQHGDRNLYHVHNLVTITTLCEEDQKLDVTHLEVACNIECNSSSGMDYIKDWEVEAKGQHPRAKNDDHRWTNRLVRV